MLVELKCWIDPRCIPNPENSVSQPSVVPKWRTQIQTKSQDFIFLDENWNEFVGKAFETRNVDMKLEMIPIPISSSHLILMFGLGLGLIQ